MDILLVAVKDLPARVSDHRGIANRNGRPGRIRTCDSTVMSGVF
jgi:hypothetical protein